MTIPHPNKQIAVYINQETTGSGLLLFDSQSIKIQNTVVASIGSEPITIGTTTVNTSAALNISSIGAVLLPRLNSTQIAALVPVSGMILYNLTSNVLQAYGSSSWVSLTT